MRTLGPSPQELDPGLDTQRPAIDPRSDVPQANVPNAITAVRTIASVSLAAVGLTHHEIWLIAAAYACYWVGDVLDGLSARLLHQETRFGAVFDIVADRACYAMAVAGLLALRPDTILTCVIFLLQFMVLDTALSLAFLRWPILSPNYFHLVHRGIYRWNWWPPAKMINTVSLVVAVAFADKPWIGAGLALGATAIKVVSLIVVARVPAPALPDRP
jgi:CDP-diacylglycerol--glycerol-3-phosphate 3-phosphatidyltransferase